MKVVTVVGTRPEIIRLSRVIAALDLHYDHTLIHTGQNYDYELNQIFFSDLELREPDIFLEAAGRNSSETISGVIKNIDKKLEIIEPDAVLILGDTNSCLSAIPAKKKQIPIFHMEAGNRCFDMRVPEEINRKIVDHIADINLTYSDIARNYLLAEGCRADQIIKTGSPMREVLEYYSEKIQRSDVLSRLKLREKDYVLVSAHREENIENDDRFDHLVSTLNKVAVREGKSIIVSTHPRTRKKIESNRFNFEENIEFLKPLAFSDYVKLQVQSKYVLSDSGTITEESSILGFDAINIRDSHERPEGMEEGSVMMSGLQADDVLRCIDILSRQRADGNSFETPADYSPANVSQKVVRIISSYVQYVNKRVWLKS